MKTEDTPVDAATDSGKKAELEIQKLQAEIRNLSRWYVPPLIQMIPTLVAVLVTLFLAWANGLLDTKQERIAIRTMLLEQEEKSVRQSVENVQSELAAVKKELEKNKNLNREFLAEEEAVKNLRTWFPHSQLISQVNAYEIKLRGREAPSIVYHSNQKKQSRLITAKEDPIKSLHTHEAIKAIGQIRNVRSLSISDVFLSRDDLAEIRNIKWLPSLSFENNGLDNLSIELFPTRPTFEDLSFTNQRFTRLPSLRGCAKLSRLTISVSKMLDHESIDSIASLNAIKILMVPIAIVDDDVQRIHSLSSLNWLEVDGTRLTRTGVLGLASHPKLTLLVIDGFKGDKHLEEEVKTIKPDITVRWDDGGT
ncbi:MAG: hypothetical protein U0941_30115 [Planctomycetaceae bacterium]